MPCVPTSESRRCILDSKEAPYRGYPRSMLLKRSVNDESWMRCPAMSRVRAMHGHIEARSNSVLA